MRMSDQRRLVARLERTYGRTLASIASAVELRDIDTAGHSRRVAQNAVALGAALGLHDRDLNMLYRAGLLHDVGKIAVPSRSSGRTDP